MKTKNKNLAILMAFFSITLFNTLNAQITATLTSNTDAHLFTWGGGQGVNSLIKFNISAIPAASTINSVVLQVYVTSKQSGWNGNIKFFNLNNQLWSESDNSTTIWSFIRSDSTHQSAGFGNTLGWTSSVNLKNIFMKDFSLSNQYCTIFMKDPDDMTLSPGWIPLSNYDTLGCGNTAFNEAIFFASKEFTNSTYKPRLIVSYVSAVGMANFNTASIICSGATTTFTDVTTNSPSAWSWNMPGAIPAVSSAKNPTVSYTTPGVYNVTLTVTTPGGTSSTIKSVTVSSCTGINEKTNLIMDAIAIYPNPVQDVVTIEISNFAKEVSLLDKSLLEIYNTDGQLVLTEKLSEGTNKIFMDKLPKGVFLFRIYKNNYLIQTKKILIQ